MWVEIKENIFESNDLKSLQFLLNIIFETKGSSYSKAKLFLDFSKIENTNLYKQLDSIDKRLIEDSYKSSSYENEININYTVSNLISDNNYNLEEAIELLREPLWIILENSKNDQEFVKAIIYHFELETDFLKIALKNRWIQFDHAGGCGGVKNIMIGRLKSFETLSLKNNTNEKKYYRSFVLLDSDKEYQNESMKEDYDKLILYLQDLGIKYHILEKRAMENYMPDEVMFEIRNNKLTSKRPDDEKCVKWINVYEYLSNDQKDYLKYIGQKDYLLLATQTQSLFANQLPTNYSILIEGINYRDNEKIGISEDQRRFKNSFPLLFVESTNVNKSTLESRCNSDELQRILCKIKESL